MDSDWVSLCTSLQTPVIIFFFIHQNTKMTYYALCSAITKGIAVECMERRNSHEISQCIISVIEILRDHPEQNINLSKNILITNYNKNIDIENIKTEKDALELDIIPSGHSDLLREKHFFSTLDFVFDVKEYLVSLGFLNSCLNK